MKNESTRKKINVDKPNYSSIWAYKQEDDGVLKLALFKDSTPLDITGQTIKLGAKRPNNSIIELTEGFKINNNELDIKLKNNILAVPGIVECDLEITDEVGRMTTASFYLTINKKITGEDNLNASNDISAINKIVEEVLAKGKELDSNIKVLVEQANKKITAIDTALNQKLNEMQADYNSLQKIIIDENQAANLQNQVNKTNAQLDTIANKGTTVEVLERVTKEEIDRQIADGTIANLMIADNSISEVKLKLLPTDFHCDNLINLPTNIITTGYFINNTGGFSSSSSSKYVKIEVTPNKEIFIHSKVGNLSVNTFGQIQLTTSNGSAIRHLNNGTNTIKDVIDSNAKYLILNLNVLNINYEGSLYVGYTEFSEKKLNGEIKYKSLFGKELTSEQTIELEKDVSKVKEEVSDITNNKLKNISVDYIKTVQSETYDYHSKNANSVSNYWYCNQHTFDEDIILESLTLTVNSETIGEKSVNFAIVDKNMNVVENTTLNFNVAQTGRFKVTIPLGERVLTAGSYICLQKVGDCSITYGPNNEHTILSVNINGNTATFGQTITGNSLNYSIAYKKWGSLTEDLNEFVRKNELSDEIGNILSQIGQNRLYGKKIIAIGDSMVQGHSIAKDKGWLAMIANRNNMTYVNYGINGTYMTNKLYNSNKGVVERYMDMDDDADYVVVFASTNDANAGVPIGTNESTNPVELKGALNIICDGLLTKYPTAKIMFITPYLRNENYRSYAQAIHDICEDKYSIKVYDNIKHGGICWTNQAQVQALTLNDTYHLNLAGMEYASYKYEEELKRL